MKWLEELKRRWKNRMTKAVADTGLAREFKNVFELGGVLVQALHQGADAAVGEEVAVVLLGDGVAVVLPALPAALGVSGVQAEEVVDVERIHPADDGLEVLQLALRFLEGAGDVVDVVLVLLAALGSPEELDGVVEVFQEGGVRV